MKRYNDAIASFDSALKIDPTDDEAMEAKLEALYAVDKTTGKYDDLRLTVQDILRTHPDKQYATDMLNRLNATK